MGAYLLASLLAAVLMIRERRRLLLFRRRYRRFLRAPWKISTFAVAAAALTVMAPYTGDPTWDYVDALVMSVLTFLTAPWVVGELFRSVRDRRAGSHTYIAACLWMISVSWFYDLYILLRAGYYPPTWLPNIVLSSILYVAAGLLWNLQKHSGRGVVFGFMTAGWPDPDADLGFREVAWMAVPIMLLVTLLIAPFLA